jgi:hypothetical protein
MSKTDMSIYSNLFTKNKDLSVRIGTAEAAAALIIMDGRA